MKRKTFRVPFLLFVLLAVVPALVTAAGGKGPTQEDLRKADYIYLEAAKAYNEQRFDDYIMLMRRAHALNPDDPYIAADLAEIEMQLSRDSVLVENAYASLRRRFDANPKESAYYTPYIKSAMELNRLDDQINAWRLLDSLMPDRNDPAYREATALMNRYTQTMDTADFSRAIGIYLRLERAMGPSAELSTQLIRAYMLRQDTASIEATLQRLAKSAPRDTRINMLVGSLYGAFNRPDSAIAFFDRAEAADTTDGTVWLARADFYLRENDSASYDESVYRALSSQNIEVEPKIELLVDYIRKQYTDTAMWPRIDALFQTLEEVNPGESKIHLLYGEFKGLQELNDEAIEQFSYSIDLDPSDREAWGNLVNAYITTKDYDKVLGTCRRGLTFFPGDVQFITLGSMSLAMNDDFPRALNLLDSIGDINQYVPKLGSEIHRMRADYLDRMGFADSSYAEYEKAIALDAGNYMAMNNAAYHMSLDSINLDKAKLYASLATESEPDNPTYIDTYAWVMYRRGDFQAAKELIDRALACYADSSAVGADSVDMEETEITESDDSAAVAAGETLEAVEVVEAQEPEEATWEVYDHAGDIYFSCGETDKAIEFWKQALTLDPENENLKQKIKKRKLISSKE